MCVRFLTEPALSEVERVRNDSFFWDDGLLGMIGSAIRGKADGQNLLRLPAD
ncbi:hypothetical protein NTG1052_220022 [Candidatus Nitrotoga sp. 1052]|nr:hypothetical protein NTG1052_220022 [Candidatus Nitrotoga sp. 1052]